MCKKQKSKWYLYYQEIKKNHPNSIVFFQMGDFFEIFGADAKEVSKLTGLTLTHRKIDDETIPMCGIPVFDRKLVNNTIELITSNGTEVVIYRQLSNEKIGGVVQRTITSIHHYRDHFKVDQETGGIFPSQIWESYGWDIYACGTQLFVGKIIATLQKQKVDWRKIDPLDCTNHQLVQIVSSNMAIYKHVHSDQQETNGLQQEQFTIFVPVGDGQYIPLSGRVDQHDTVENALTAIETHQTSLQSKIKLQKRVAQAKLSE